MSASSDPSTPAELVNAARLRQAETLESVGRLAGGIAHDFNNLLTSILGYSELLDDQLRRRGNARAERSDLKEIRMAAERARELTHRLLAFSRRVPTQPRRLDLRQIVARMERLLRRLVSEKITVALNVTETSCHVLADPTQLEQVLLSLAVNACDAMPDGGVLTIAIECRDVNGQHGPPSGEVIGAVKILHGPYVELSVGDTGRGMDTEYVYRAFEPFVTTKTAGQGLGLSAVYGIVTRTGGVVIVDSAVGVGTTVRVLLPRRLGDIDSDLPEASQPGRGGGEIILLAEDDADVRTLNERTLREAGYEVLTAQDGNAAIEIAARTGQQIDLLLTDVIMPGRNGWEVAEAIQAQRPEILVLFVSGFAPTSLTPSHLPETGFPFLAKPFTPSALLQRVRQLFDASRSNREG